MLVVLACGWFAFGSIPTIDARGSPNHPPSDAVTSAPTTDSFDRNAFDVVLWNPTESRRASNGGAGSGAASRPAARLQLVGITEEKSGLHAALYDPEADRLYVVASGDRIPGQRVEKLTSTEIVLVGTTGTSRIALRKERP
jgi:hypothetical protein